jgi:RHS repeat-associated protein
MSVSDQSNGSQSVTASRVYDAFGNVASSTGTFVSPFGYGGGFGYQEDGTGLKLLGHRLYDSSMGRFLTRDPIKDGRNWYVYCENDPINFYDDWGNSRKGNNAARRAEKGIGKGPKDCEDWILKYPYPGEWPNGRAHEVPGKIREQPDWKEVPNDGNFEPGDLIISDRGDRSAGHIIIVGDETRKEKRRGKDGKVVEVELIEINDASLGRRDGTKRWIPKKKYRDSLGRPTSIWRPLDI